MTTTILNMLSDLDDALWVVGELRTATIEHPDRDYRNCLLRAEQSRDYAISELTIIGMNNLI